MHVVHPLKSLSSRPLPLHRANTQNFRFSQAMIYYETPLRLDLGDKLEKKKKQNNPNFYSPRHSTGAAFPLTAVFIFVVMLPICDLLFAMA